MKLNNKQQLGIGLGAVALITFFTSMGVKLFRSIKEETIKRNCENYPIENIDTEDMQEFKEDDITEQSQILTDRKDNSNIGEYK